MIRLWKDMQKRINILFTQNEELDRLLIGVGGQHYVKFLLEHLEKGLGTILPWNNICKNFKGRYLFVIKNA